MDEYWGSMLQEGLIGAMIVLPDFENGFGLDELLSRLASLMGCTGLTLQCTSVVRLVKSAFLRILYLSFACCHHPPKY